MITLELRAVVNRILESNMGAAQSDRVLIVNDVLRPEDWAAQPVSRLEAMAARSVLARTVADLARDLTGWQAALQVFPATHQSGTEPPADVVQAMAASDVVLLITTYSLTHTRAVSQAADGGSRIASMPGVTVDMFGSRGPLSEDPVAMHERSVSIAELLTAAAGARVTTPAGTDLQLSLAARTAGIDAGLLREPGSVGNLPGGEVYIAPVEGTATGRLVVPAREPNGGDLTLTFERGRVVVVDGGGDRGERLRALLLDNPAADHRCNCAELAVGVNRRANETGITLEAEKALGTVHVAVGDNRNLGGMVESDLHVDFVLTGPTLYVDDREIITRGIMNEI